MSYGREDRRTGTHVERFPNEWTVSAEGDQDSERKAWEASKYRGSRAAAATIEQARRRAAHEPVTYDPNFGEAA